MDGKINLDHGDLLVKKSFDEDYNICKCPATGSGCHPNCALFGEPKTMADGKTALQICQGKTLVFNTFTIE